MSDTSNELAVEAAASFSAVEQSRSHPEMSLKQYFDEKLHPKLSAALNACAVERPADPVSFVGNYLLSHPEKSV
jgi:hypothetical protein